MASEAIDFAELAQTYSWPPQEIGRRPHVRLNMAIDALGQSVDHNGLSTGLSFPEDRQLLKIIRSGAQAVIVGAKTIRAEGWNLPAQGLLVVLTQSGSLPWESCPDRERVRVVTDTRSMETIIDGLAQEGMSNILVEGGGSVATLFALENLLDDVCLTISLGTDSGPEPTREDPKFSRAISSLLGTEPSCYTLISWLPVPQSPAVFTFWRRAIIAPGSVAH